MIGKQNLLLSITTTTGTDWRARIDEAAELGVAECALFLTCLLKKERYDLYGALEKSSIKSCPFIHLRSDMDADELEFLINKFGAKVFNIHCERENKLEYDLSKYADMIYVENVYDDFDPEEMKQWAGVCLDISHLENDRLLNPAVYEAIALSLKKYRIGCNHISAMSDTIRVWDGWCKRYDRHYFDSLEQFDYLKRYPAEYFSGYCALEVTNNFKEQIAARDYIAGL